MKLSDYVSVIMIAVFGTVLAYFLTNSLLGDPKDKTVSFEYIETITSDLTEPDSELFNAGAINPTVEIYVGSCVDRNSDGVIDEGELAECGQATPESESSDGEGNEEELDEDNEAINRREGYASGTTAEQRQNVQNIIDEYEQEQNNSRNVIPSPNDNVTGN